MSAHLTPRQMEVLRLLWAGNEIAVIGKHLRRSTKTAEYHLARLYLKSGTINHVQLCRWGLENGLIKTWE